MSTQWVKDRSAVMPANLPSSHSQKDEKCSAGDENHVTVQWLASKTDPNAYPKTYQHSNILDEFPIQQEANHKICSTPVQIYQIDKSSLRTRKRAWQEEQNDLSRVLDQERQAWSKRSYKDLRKQYNTSQAEQTLAENENYADTHTTSDREETSRHHRPQRRSNFMEGSMTEGSRGTASTWQEQSVKIPETPKAEMDEESDLDATPRPSDLDQTSARSSFDINDFKPLPPTPSTLASTLKRFGKRFKAAEAKQDLPQMFTSETQTLKVPRRGLRKSLSSWKIFNSSASETSDVESDYTDDLRPVNTLRGQTVHTTPSESILDERKRKAEIAYAEQFGTSKKRQKDNFGRGRLSTDQTYSDSEHVTVRNRYRMSMSNLKAVPSAVRSEQPDASARNPEPPSHNFLKQQCAESISDLPPLPRDSSLNFDNDIDRKKRRRRSYSALEKENQYLRQQLKASEGREAAKRGNNTAKTSSNNTTSNGISPGSVTSEKIGKALGTLPQSNDVLNNPASSSRQRSTESRNTQQIILLHEKVSQKPPGIEASELSQIIRETLPLPSPTRLPSSPSILCPLSLNASYSRDSATITHRHLSNSAKKDNTFEIPRSLSMVLEGVEEDENGESGENIGYSTATKSKLSGRRTARHIVESEPRKVEGKWEWPEDVF